MSKTYTFDILNTITAGQYGDVLEVRWKGVRYIVKRIRCVDRRDAMHCLNDARSLRQQDEGHRVRIVDLFLTGKSFSTVVFTSEKEDVLSAIDTSPNLLYLVAVMPLYKDSDLLAYVTERYGGGPVSEVRALYWIRDVLSFLVSFHAAGYVHMDIRPSNLLISDGHIHVEDLGTLKRGGRVGSPPYMSPELVSHHSYSAAVDVWSAGSVLFHLLVGMRAPVNLFSISSGGDGEMAQYLTTALQEHGVSVATIRLITLLLRRDPHRRISSAKALATLNVVLSETELGGQPSPSVGSPTPPRAPTYFPSEEKWRSTHQASAGVADPPQLHSHGKAIEYAAPRQPQQPLTTTDSPARGQRGNADRATLVTNARANGRASPANASPDRSIKTSRQASRSGSRSASRDKSSKPWRLAKTLTDTPVPAADVKKVSSPHSAEQQLSSAPNPADDENDLIDTRRVVNMMAEVRAAREKNAQLAAKVREETALISELKSILLNLQASKHACVPHSSAPCGTVAPANSFHHPHMYSSYCNSVYPTMSSFHGYRAPAVGYSSSVTSFEPSLVERAERVLSGFEQQAQAV